MKRRLKILAINEHAATHLTEMAFRDASMYLSSLIAISPDIEALAKKLDRKERGALAIYDHVIVNCQSDDLGVLFAFQAAKQFPKQSIILSTKSTLGAMSEGNLHIFGNLAEAMKFIREAR
jgi:hypothetical protein